MPNKLLKIEVVYATPNKQWLVNLQVKKGSTTKQVAKLAIQQNLIPNVAINDLSVWYKVVTEDYLIKDKDRVEILRPLAMTPEEIRQKKIAKSKQKFKR